MTKREPTRALTLGPQDSTKILVDYRGVKTPLDHRRIVELLDIEQEYYGGARAVSTLAPQPVLTEGTAVSYAPTVDSEHSVSHASLSNRVKRIHSYSVKRRELRPTHVGLLAELLQNFDWNLPDYENVQLKTQLGDIASWPSVSASLKAQILSFLERYRALRPDRDRTAS